MATFNGRDGVVEIGSNKILKLQSWTYNETAATVEADGMEDQWMTRHVDIKDASGDLTFFDDDTTSGNAQSSLVVGAQVTLKLYGRGTGAGKIYRSGPAIITSVSANAAKGATVEGSASWVAAGEWDFATVAA